MKEFALLPGAWIIVLCMVAAIYESKFRIRRQMRRYWDRACTGFQWRRRFPDASKTDIRRFLELFVNAFAFRQSRRLCFSPDDKVMEIYRTLYPDRFTPDMMELEMLAKFLHERYALDAAAFWREDITLGELFTHTRAV
jgi:propanediol dehydratase small subunit